MHIQLEIVASYDPSSHSTTLRSAVYRIEPDDGSIIKQELHGRRRELIWDEGQADSVRIDALKAIERFSDFAYFAGQPF